MAAAHKDSATADKAADEARSQAEALGRELAGANGEVATLRADGARAQAAAARANGEVVALGERVEEAGAALAAAKEEVGRLAGEHAAAHARIDALQVYCLGVSLNIFEYPRP